jgi:hypothetical protein
VTSGKPGADDHLPAIDEAEISELLDAGLSRTEAGEEEIFELRGIEVAVVVECLEDDQVALGDCAEEMSGFLGRWCGLSYAWEVWKK